MHSGFALTGLFNSVLLILFFLIIISGIIGSLIYNIVPRSLTKYGRDVNQNEEIVKKMEYYLKEADRLASNTSDEFREFYKKRIRPFFRSKRTKWEYLFMEERELINKRKSMMESYKSMLTGQGIYDLNILTSVLVEKEKLAFMCTKIKALEAWLNFHMPLTSAMLTMVLIHIVLKFYY
jgi:hypothetical protein